MLFPIKFTILSHTRDEITRSNSGELSLSISNMHSCAEPGEEVRSAYHLMENSGGSDHAFCKRFSENTSAVML